MIKIVFVFYLAFTTWSRVDCPADSEPLGMQGHSFVLAGGGNGIDTPPGECWITLRKQNEPTVDSSFKYCGLTTDPSTGTVYTVWARVQQVNPPPPWDGKSKR